ncbi:uncharacterized protein [Linepithema humile]|uniref:uncharacterized protein n=1 Tax=Linepithema humile TaxID=83485 RepID=UPI00351DF94E
MYLKRTSKLLDLSVPQITADVHLRDLTCPICRGILIEPVTLPCTHNLCLGCLKGTFEHNSLNCPLCRVRVGSWLRTATKSETLVNNDLWDLIRAKFPKEVESKHHGEEGDLDLDADYAPNRILSAAGEIHREYEMQLKMAEEEMRRQRQAEQMASEALIQKIQAEQQLLLAQLAQDELLAKSLAKQQVVENQKVTTKCYNERLNTSISSCVFDTSRFNTKNTFVNNVKALQTESVHLEDRQMNSLEDVGDGLKRQTNIERLSKIEAIYSNVYNSNETNASNSYKNRVKYCCQKQMPVYNAVTKPLKHQTVSKFIQPCTSNYMDPGCSTSRAYTTETKEELHVPNDVVNNKKKSLGIEICMTLADNDERIGSAESSGSHDSINQEIHHFKPIKAVPRTKLKISTDGKLMDPKLIRVIPILKKVSNAVPKPPSPTYMKRIIGCSWSAFRGKIKQDVKKKQPVHNLYNVEDTKKTLINQNSSTSPLDYSLTVSDKFITKLQTNDAIRRLDFMPELSSFDDNKNYTKNAGKIVNDTKMSKITLDSESDARKSQKSWKKRTKNNMVTKYKRYRNLRNIRRGTELTLNATDEEEDNSTGFNSSFGETSLQNDEQHGNDNITVDNTMEGIKRKKENMEQEMLISETESNRPKRSKTTKNKALSETRNKSPPAANQILLSSFQESTKHDGNCTPHTHRTKRRKISRTSHSNTNGSEKSELSKDASNKIVSSLRKSARNLTKISSKVDSHESNSTRNKSNSKLNDSLSTCCDETEECVEENHHIAGKLLLDKEVIEEQQRIERLLLQEREDLEFARRLQAQFDEMEWISGRTRRSRKATENVKNEVDSREIDSAMRIVYGTSKAHETSKRKPIANEIVSTTAKRKLGRPPKCVKVTLQTCKNESGAR